MNSCCPGLGENVFEILLDGNNRVVGGKCARCRRVQLRDVGIPWQEILASHWLAIGEVATVRAQSVDLERVNAGMPWPKEIPWRRVFFGFGGRQGHQGWEWLGWSEESAIEEIAERQYPFAEIIELREFSVRPSILEDARKLAAERRRDRELAAENERLIRQSIRQLNDLDKVYVLPGSPEAIEFEPANGNSWALAADTAGDDEPAGVPTKKDGE